MVANGNAGSIYDGIQAASGAFKFFAGGCWRESSSGKTVSILNPSTRQPCYAVQGRQSNAVGALFKSSIGELLQPPELA